MAWLPAAYLAAMAAVYLLYVLRKPATAKAAATASVRQFGKVLPTLLAVFGLIGLFEVYMPPSLIERWMGSSSGIGSLLIGTAAGSIAAGSPAAAYPAAGLLLHDGAWIGAVAAFLTAWVLVGVVTLPFEAKEFGWRFALLRNGSALLLAVVIGLVMGWML